MEDKLVSIIIPVYKVERYLRDCVDSIINQTYQNMEIILVNDGSPDRCGEICDEYAENDDRVLVIHKSNGGLSDARNHGLAQAHGEYIAFVDSDDLVEQDGISKLVRLSDTYDADIVIGGVEKFEDKTQAIIWTTEDKNNINKVTELSREDAIKDFFVNGCASWARLYKSHIHKDIKFPVGEINEDEAVVLDLLEKSSVVVKTTEVIYKYRFRKQSITSTSWNERKLDWCNHCKNNLSIVEHKYPDLIPYAKERYVSSLIWALNNMSVNPNAFTDLIDYYRGELKSNLKSINFELINKKEKKRAYGLAYFFKGYSILVRLLGKQYT